MRNLNLYSGGFGFAGDYLSQIQICIECLVSMALQIPRVVAHIRKSLTEFKSHLFQVVGWHESLIAIELTTPPVVVHLFQNIQNIPFLEAEFIRIARCEVVCSTTLALEMKQICLRPFKIIFYCCGKSKLFLEEKRFLREDPIKVL